MFNVLVKRSIGVVAKGAQLSNEWAIGTFRNKQCTRQLYITASWPTIFTIENKGLVKWKRVNVTHGDDSCVRWKRHTSGQYKEISPDWSETIRPLGLHVECWYDDCRRRSGNQTSVSMNQTRWKNGCWWIKIFLWKFISDSSGQVSTASSGCSC